MIPDKKGYGFDGCSPKMLMDWATVENGKIVFPGATSYEIMVLPNFETMTPELLKKVTLLLSFGLNVQPCTSLISFSSLCFNSRTNTSGESDDDDF